MRDRRRKDKPGQRLPLPSLMIYRGHMAALPLFCQDGRLRHSCLVIATMPLRPLFPFLCLLALAGCASHAPQPSTAPIPPVEDTTAAEPVYTPFPPKTLESILLAEFAGHRQRADITLAGYVQQAVATRDPGIVARASTIAQLLNQPQSLELSRIWTEVEPGNPDAWYLLVLSCLRQQKFDQFMPALDRLLALQPEADLEQMFLSAVPASPAARDSLLKALDGVGQHHQNSPHIFFARALVQSQNGTLEPALENARKARQLRPQSPQATLLEAKLLADLGRNAEASRLLAGAVKAQPESQSLRLNYAHTLVRVRDMKGAEREFGTLVDKHPADDRLRLGLALIAFENRNDALAQSELEILTDSEEHSDEAYFYLGKLAHRQGKADEAIAAYENVPPGQHYLPAMAEISHLLLSQNQPEESRRHFAEARTRFPDLRISLYQLEAELLSNRKDFVSARALLDEALQLTPGDTQLLLSRALVAERQNQLEQFEADVREVLRMEPDNASALNALGYTLLDRTGRIDEAEAYIRRAQALKPDDPAILDSIGWVKFKRGDTEGALADLRRAYQLYPDDEIAAHLGEVLWERGQREEARKLWNESLRQHPDSDYIPRTRMRLDP